MAETCAVWARRAGQWFARSVVLLGLVAAPFLGGIKVAHASEPMPPPASTTARDFRLLHNLSVFYSLTIWPAGKTISVCFFAEYPEFRQALVNVARQWQSVANVFFDFGPLPDYQTCKVDLPSDIRVRFSGQIMGVTAGSSRIGTTSLGRPPSEPTLRIATRAAVTGVERKQEQLAATILHEFGHALGLGHEHQHPQSACPSEHHYAAICTSRPPPGGDAKHHTDIARKRADLYRSMGLFLEPVPVLDLPYDRHSIMHYRFSGQHLQQGNRSPCFSALPRTISEGDKRRIGRLYPRDPAEQARLIEQQIEVFRQTLKALQISSATGMRMASIVQAVLRLRHGGDISIVTADLGLPDADTTALEESLIRPLKPELPGACLAPAQGLPQRIDGPLLVPSEQKAGLVPAK